MNNTTTELDTVVTIRKTKFFEEQFRAESREIVASHARKASAEMKRSSPKLSGRLKKSISIRQVSKTRELGAVEKGLHKTVHPRNRKGGSHSHFTNNGTRDRKTKRSVGKWGTNRGRVRGTGWQQKAGEAIAGSFRSQVSKRVNKNEDL